MALKLAEKQKSEALKDIRLIVLEGVNKGKKYRLGGKVLTLGRSKDNHIEFISTKISKNHAKLELKKDQILISDLGSSNGTFVNGKKISKAYLSPGDKISLGGACEIEISGKFSTPSEAKSDETLGDLLGDVASFEKGLDSTNVLGEKTEHLVLEEEAGGELKKKSNMKNILLILLLAGIGFLALEFVGETPQEEVKAVKSGGKESISSVRAVAPYKDKFLKKDLDFKRIREGEIRTNAQVEAERLYVHAKQVYISNRFHEAISLFREVLLFDKNHTMARVYLERAQGELSNLIDIHDKQGRELFSNLRYHQAAIEFRAVINLLRDNKDDPRYKDAKEYIQIIRRKNKRY